MTEKEKAKAAREFAEYWADKGYEKGESQKFWLSLLHDVLGVENPVQFINFEEQVHLDNTSFIDAVIPTTKVMIEQKSSNKDLRKPCPTERRVTAQSLPAGEAVHHRAPRFGVRRHR